MPKTLANQAFYLLVFKHKKNVGIQNRVISWAMLISNQCRIFIVVKKNNRDWKENLIGFNTIYWNNYLQSFAYQLLLGSIL